MARIEDLVRAGREMRALQQRFFDGDKTVVGRAKAAERAFDGLLAQFPDFESPNLFDDFAAPVPVVTVGAASDDEDRGPWWAR